MIDDASVQVNLGAVQSLCGKLSLAFVVRNNGDGHLQIYCSDPSNGRKAGVLLTLDQVGYDQLKSLIQKADHAIDNLRAAGQMKRMLVSYG